VKKTNFQTRLYYNTIDLDGYNINHPKLKACLKEELERVILKIEDFGRKHDCLERLIVEDSKKGYHIILLCRKPCNLCRFVFDDFERYRRDINRPRYMQNVIFNSLKFKKIKLGGKKLIEKAE